MKPTLSSVLPIKSLVHSPSLALLPEFSAMKEALAVISLILPSSKEGLERGVPLLIQTLSMSFKIDEAGYLLVIIPNFVPFSYKEFSCSATALISLCSVLFCD